MDTLSASAVALAQRHGQNQFPQRPIWGYFTASVQKRIRQNPFGAISFAAQCIAEREVVLQYCDSLPIPEELRREIRHILVLDYYNHGE